jgi:hypothetical protein
MTVTAERRAELEEQIRRAQLDDAVTSIQLAYSFNGPQAQARAMWRRVTRNVRMAAVRAPRTLLFAAIGGGVGWIMNVGLMMFHHQGYMVPKGSVATGRGNTFSGSAFWFCLSFLVSAIVSFRLRQGKERFRASVRELPRTLVGYARSDRNAVSHLLWGVGTSVLLMRIVGPGLATVLAAGTLLSLGSVIRPLIFGAVSFVWRSVGKRLRGADAHPQGPTQSAVGVAGLGAGVGTLAGYIVTDGTARLALVVLAVAGAVALSRVGGRTTAAPPSPSPAAAVLVFVLAAVGFGLFFAAGVAWADDGGWSECRGHVSGCPGTATLLALGLLGAGATATGSGLGHIMGDGAGDEDQGPECSNGPCGMPDPTPQQDAMAERIARSRAEAYASKQQLEKELGALEQWTKDVDKQLAGFEEDVKKRSALIDEIVRHMDETNADWDHIGKDFGGRMTRLVMEDIASLDALKRVGWTFAALPEGAAEGLGDTMKLVRDIVPMTGTAIEWWLTAPNKSSELSQFSADTRKEFGSWLNKMEQAAGSGDTQAMGDLLGKAVGSQAITEALGIGFAKVLAKTHAGGAGSALERAAATADDAPDLSGALGGGTHTIDAATAAAQGTSTSELGRVSKVLGEFSDTVEEASFRPSNPDRALWINEHADSLAMKPEGFYPKTINEIDNKYLGYGSDTLPNGGRGLCGFRDPIPPGSPVGKPPPGVSPGEWKNVWSRFEERAQEYTMYSKKMGKAETEGYHFREGGKQVTYKVNIDPNTGIVKTGDRLRTWEDALGRTQQQWETIKGAPEGPLGLRPGEKLVPGDLDILGVKWTDKFMDKVRAAELRENGAGQRMLMEETVKLHRRLNQEAGTMHAGTGNLDPMHWSFKRYDKDTQKFLRGQIARVEEYYRDLPGQVRANAIIVTKDTSCLGLAQKPQSLFGKRVRKRLARKRRL